MTMFADMLGHCLWLVDIQFTALMKRNCLLQSQYNGGVNPHDSNIYKLGFEV